MKKCFYSLVIFSLLTSPAFAQDEQEAKVQGTIEAGYRVVDSQDEDNRAHFVEYRDLDDDFFGGIDLDVQQGSHYLRFRSGNIGLDDQSYLLEGTDFGNFSYKFFYDEIPHNISFDARAPYGGIGDSNLDVDINSINVTDWSVFDYSVNREEYGGQVRISLETPFYVTMGIQRREQDGVKPLGSGDFWLSTEMPEPVDYTTDDLTFQGGYRSKKLQASIQGYWSTFDNNNNSMTQPNTGEILALPPDNDYGKVAGNLSWRGLPLQSLLAVRASYARIDNDFSAEELHLGNLNSSFEGEYIYTKGSIALSSRPTSDLDTKVYYTYLDKENDSSLYADQVEDTHYSDHIFDYEKNNAGLDVGYHLPHHTKLEAGYEFLDIDRRNREDGESTTDHSIFLQVKNSSLDLLTARLRYERLERDTDFEGDSTFRRYDVTDKSMDEIRLALEFYPLHQLDFGFEYAYKMNDYDETDLGRTEDERHEIYADFVWHAAENITVNGFAGYEISETDSSHRQVGGGDTFGWSKERDDDYWIYGLAVDLPDVVEKLSLRFAWQYQESDGEVNFTSPSATLSDISESDDYDKQELEARATYALRTDLDITLGYLYEKYDYDDLQYTDYMYYQTATYLTGAYYERSYEANVGYLMVAYNF